MHAVHGVALGARGDEEARFGDPELHTFWRSAMKPFQALPAVEDGALAAFGFGADELALCCASHGGTNAHVSLARAMLDRLALPEEALACGPHPPYDRPSAEAVLRGGGRFGRLHNNCSGKHAGMLALALHHGWPTEGYEGAEHPVQVRIREGLERWIGRPASPRVWAPDGCGVPTPFVTLRDMARAYRRLGAAARAGEEAPAAVVGAMTTRPERTSSPGRFPLSLMRATGGRLLAKEGAEGILCVAAAAEGWGLALKVEDGARRAVGPAAVAMLSALGLLARAEEEDLAEEARAPVRDTRGCRVGEVVADVRATFATGSDGG